jgi:hypothetical protein
MGLARQVQASTCGQRAASGCLLAVDRHLELLGWLHLNLFILFYFKKLMEVWEMG